MKKNILFIILLIVLSFNVLGTCIDDVCSSETTNIYPQNINNFEGKTEVKEITLVDEIGANIGEFLIERVNDDNTISVDNLGDETNIKFVETGDEFFDDLLKQNAEGTLNLFTQKDLNQKIREKTTIYIMENVNWIYILIVMTMELFKIIVNLLIILLTIWTFFRIIPFTFKFIKNTIFKILVKVEK